MVPEKSLAERKILCLSLAGKITASTRTKATHVNSSKNHITVLSYPVSASLMCFFPGLPVTEYGVAVW